MVSGFFSNELSASLKWAWSLKSTTKTGWSLPHSIKICCWREGLVWFGFVLPFPAISGRLDDEIREWVHRGDCFWREQAWHWAISRGGVAHLRARLTATFSSEGRNNLALTSPFGVFFSYFFFISVDASSSYCCFFLIFCLLYMSWWIIQTFGDDAIGLNPWSTVSSSCLWLCELVDNSKVRICGGLLYVWSLSCWVLFVFRDMLSDPFPL